MTAYVSPSKDQLKRENSELHDENEELKSTLDEMQTASKEWVKTKEERWK